MADFFAMTNRLRGTLNGNLVVTNANTHIVRTWNGYGGLQLCAMG